MHELRKTVCNRDCPDACALVATIETAHDGERVTKIGGDPAHPVTRGFLCYRTNHFLNLQYSPARLTTPLLRRNGELCPVTWDEALAFVAARLLAIRAESGPAAIFHYRSGGSLGLLKHLSDYFFELLGPCTTKRGDICSGAGDAAQYADFGEEDSNDLFDLGGARNIILWGKNVFVSSPHLVPVLREAAARGAHLTLIDPVHHRTVALCERYMQPRPGGDFALAMAVGKLLFERGWIDSEAHRYCDNLDGFRDLVDSRTLATWCAEADVTQEEALDLAHRLGVERPTTILVGWGMARRINGAGIVRALDALSAITGNVGVPGGGVSYYFKRRDAFDLSFLAGEKAAPRTICEPLLGPEILASKDPPIRAVWVTAANPVAMLPESETTAHALATRDLVVVVDSFLTDTAALAHAVLPTTTLLEADDLVGSYGHHFLGVPRPVIASPPGVKSDLEILQALAARLGLPALERAMSGDVRSWKRRLIEPKLRPHGITLEALETAPLRNPRSPRVLFEGRRFATPTGRVNLLTKCPPSQSVDRDYPLFLLSLSTEKAQSSQWSVLPPGPAVVTVHPDSAGRLADGSRARLESRIGSMAVRVRLDPRQRRDVAVVPKGGHLRDGRCANALIRARTTDAGEGGALYDERVRLVPSL